MDTIVSSPTGWVHLIASVLALFFGTLVLFLPKGSKRHIQAGYWYVGSMTVLIITAFMIYRLFNGWGVFHYTTVVSLVTLLMGMLPVWMRQRFKNWQALHFSFMYWSVIGLYAAFAAEIMTRMPGMSFFGMVGIATAVIMFIGGVFFAWKKQRWLEVFTQE